MISLCPATGRSPNSLQLEKSLHTAVKTLYSQKAIQFKRRKDGRKRRKERNRGTTEGGRRGRKKRKGRIRPLYGS